MAMLGMSIVTVGIVVMCLYCIFVFFIDCLVWKKGRKGCLESAMLTVVKFYFFS